jgi:hypothetical protein
MMLFTVICIVVLLLFTTTAEEKLHLTLEPALDFHEALGNSGERLFFRVVQPQAANSCTEQPARCGGDFALDLGMYDGIEISFQAPEGKEIHIFASQVNDTSSQSYRVTVIFLAKADCVLTSSVPLVVKDIAFTPEIVGSNVEDLVANYNESNSFMEVGKCQVASRMDYCTKRRECQIFTSLDFWADDTSFQGTISKMTWSITYDRSIFGNVGELDFRYDTDGLQGYTWIQTPFTGALVPASPTEEATVNPTSGTDSLPSLVFILSASVFVLLLISN